MNRELKGALLTAFGGICWGLSGSVGQYLFHTEGMDSSWLVPIRLGLAGILLFLYNLITRPRLLFGVWRTRRNIPDILIYGILGISFAQFTYFFTIQHSSAGVATILQDLSPVAILLFSCMTGRRLPRIYEVAATLLALLGVILIITHGDFSRFSVPPAAIAAGVLSALCVTVYNVAPGKLLAQFPVTVLQAWSFLMGSLLIGMIFRPWKASYIPTAAGWAGIAFVVVVGNILAFTAYVTGVKYIGPEKGILYGFLEPITAAAVSFVFLRTPFTVWDGIGFFCIFLMLLLISSVNTKKRPVDHP